MVLYNLKKLSCQIHQSSHLIPVSFENLGNLLCNYLLYISRICLRICSVLFNNDKFCFAQSMRFVLFGSVLFFSFCSHKSNAFRHWRKPCDRHFLKLNFYKSFPIYVEYSCFIYVILSNFFFQQIITYNKKLSLICKLCLIKLDISVYALALNIFAKLIRLFSYSQAQFDIHLKVHYIFYQEEE